MTAHDTVLTIIDTASTTRRVLAAPPSERAELLRQVRAPLNGMFPFIPGGPDQFEIHRGTYGYPIEGSDARILDALARLEDADAWGRIRRALAEGIAALTSAVPDLSVPDLTVHLTVGDPGDTYFMDEIQGLSAFGGMSGYIEITVWPHDVVLDRLEAIAVHELHHNVRYGPGGVVWDPMRVQLGEQVVAEGLADAFAAELYGERGWTHFVDDASHGHDVVGKVRQALDISGVQHFMPWILGDAGARRLGLDPVGVPTGAGYAAGRALVAQYLRRSGRSAAEAVRTPWRQVVGGDAR